MSLLDATHASTAYRRDQHSQPRVPVVLPLVHVTIDDTGQLEVVVDHQPFGADQVLTRNYLRGVIDQIAGEAASPIRVEIHAPSIETLASFWLIHRQTHGRAGQAGALRPSTLGAYDAVLRTIIVPALGGYRVGELNVGILETAFADIERSGRSTAQARSVLSQMLGLGVRHGAIAVSPMPLVEKPAREPHEVQAPDVDAARQLRRVVDPAHRRTPGRRGPNRDLADLVDLFLGTGMRIGEVLALRWRDLDVAADPPTVRVSGTLLEPRRGHVHALTRQDETKTGGERTLILPSPVVQMLAGRRRRTRWRRLDDPVFASGTGSWLWPSNIRTRLRLSVAGVVGLEGTTPHTLRRTVGTLVAHEAGLDAAREQLGHSDPSITYQRYVAARRVAPDLRPLLDRFFVDDDTLAMKQGDVRS